MQALFARPQLPGVEIALWIVSTWWALALLIPTVFIPLVFPYGALPSRRWRPWAYAAGAIVAIPIIGTLFAAGLNYDVPLVDNPFGVPGAAALQYGFLALPAAYALGVAAIITRRRRATGDEREQMRWLVYAVSLLAAGLVASLFTGDWGALPAVVTLGPFLLVPVAIGAAILKYRLYDIDVIINRTLVYGGLSAAVLAGYGLFVVIGGALLPFSVEWRESVLAAGALALLAYPVREWLQSGVNRLMFGDRDAPYAAMSRLAHRIADTAASSAVLPAVAEAVAEGLRLPYAAIELPGGTPVEHGILRGQPQRIPLVHQGVEVGEMVLAPRTPRGQFSTADLRLLDDVARQVAMAAHAVRLAADLQRSRERLVLAREEERRRLRRDLHDGLGSALAGLTLYAGNARGALRDDPDAAQAWLGQLEDGIRAVVKDIRRLAYDLRPPALDELGLVGALGQHAEGMATPTRMTAPDDLPPLPAAVEVAAYRIVAEAMLNVDRHADATRCDVRLAIGDALTVEICDDGRGLPARLQTGVGLLSIKERAAELGGGCEIESAPGGGTLLRAVLPLERHE